MQQKKGNLVWIDMEMTGLDPNTNVILEAACIVTDSRLEALAEMEPIAVAQPQHELDKMDEWNQHTHNETGLISRVNTSDIGVEEAESTILDFLRPWVEPGQSPICGNSIGQDRRFINKYMPRLDAFLHYRVLDVTSIKILAKLWRPEIAEAVVKKNTHSALSDIQESINELKSYQEHFFNLKGD